MNTLITYDVTRRHSEVKKAMQSLGYSDYLILNKQTYNLPNTTLWKAGAPPETDLETIKAVISKLNQGQLSNQIRLERCVSVSVDSLAGIAGDSHSEQRM